MVKGLVLAQVHIGVFLYVFNTGIRNEQLYRSFGFAAEEQVHTLLHILCVLVYALACNARVCMLLIACACLVFMLLFYNNKKQTKKTSVFYCKSLCLRAHERNVVHACVLVYACFLVCACFDACICVCACACACACPCQCGFVQLFLLYRICFEHHFMYYMRILIRFPCNTAYLGRLGIVFVCLFASGERCVVFDECDLAPTRISGG